MWGFGTLEIELFPLISQNVLISLMTAGLFLLALTAWKRRDLFWGRLLVTALFLLALANPSVLSQQREAVKDVVVVAVDRSQSQTVEDRAAQTSRALTALQDKLAALETLEVRTVETAAQDSTAGETRIFGAIEQALADIPEAQRAGVIVISDGQIHDAPDAAQPAIPSGPISLLLSGRADEKDRRLILTKAPAYGITGQSVTIGLKIEDTGFRQGAPIDVTLRHSDAPARTFAVHPGEEYALSVPITHAGQNVFEIEAAHAVGEISTANNRRIVIINGVRDRLKVLLVSGKPHAGGRMWRDLLTADPGIDLIHFTILRDPEKLDTTPQHELSLIAFPVQELFEKKLYDFDLVIFDQYRLNYILPDYYFENIANYVREGGAFLAATGPAFASAESLYNTALRDILPGQPTGRVFSRAFVPALSETGRLHPVTQPLAGLDTAQDWGTWQRYIDTQAKRGDVLMAGPQGGPLLLLDRVGKGRVAQIASDHIWLWARHYDGGGPYLDLLRRTVHWLMKEPELEEDALLLSVTGSTVSVRKPFHKDDTLGLEVTWPDGSVHAQTLRRDESGALGLQMTAPLNGIYRFATPDGGAHYVAVGPAAPPEMENMLSTADKVAPLIQATGGRIMRLSEHPTPDIRHSQNALAGPSAIPLRRNNAFQVKAQTIRPLLPSWGWAALVIGALLMVWWREGKR